MNSGLRLLLVEDSPDDAELIVRELRRNAYDLYFERVDTSDAMNAALDRQDWDVIIADYSMPTFTGLEALELMQSRNLDVPFLLVSGTVGEEIAVTAMKAGAHDYVLKDRLTRLGPAIARELREAELRRDQKKSGKERIRLLRELQEAVRVRDEFLSIASHELRTPLTPLQIHLQSLLRQLKKNPANVTTDRLIESLKVAENQVQRITGLIATLLDISRITSGRLDLKYEDLDLAALLREVALRMESEILKAGCTLILNADQPVKGRWDRLRLDQVLTNLLSNAIKYGPGKPIEVHVTGNNSHGRFSVRDFGIGIEQQDQTRIFERFERAVRAEHYGGFGLGLWIVGQVISAHGGTIRVESRPGEGALFDVELPCAHLEETTVPEGGRVNAGTIDS